MAHPALLGDGLAAVLVAVGAYCVARLAAGAPTGRGSHDAVNLGRALMALAMVGVLVPGWKILPRPVWAVVSAGVALWFFGRAFQLATRSRSRSPLGPFGMLARRDAVHGVMALSMVYMESVRPLPGRAGAAMAAAGDPVVALALMVVLLVSAVWQLNAADQLVALAHAPVGRPAPPPSRQAPRPPARSRSRPAPRLEVACHVAMCVVMAYMLALMV